MKHFLFLLLTVSASAQNLAVLPASVGDPNAVAAGCPPNWPVAVRELGSGTTLPGVGWILHTRDSYNTLLATNSVAKAAWNALMDSRPIALQSINAELARRLQGNNWDDPAYRALALICQDMALIHEIIVRANLQTNLTVPKRTRANALSNELATIYGYWKAANDLRQKIPTNATPVIVTTDPSWPATPIGE